MECVFCQIINGKIEAMKIWENDQFILLLDRKPINRGHVMLIPKTHIENVFNMPEPAYNALFRTAKDVAPILQELTQAKRIGLAIEGFGVPHVHVHLVPVNKGNQLNPLRAKEVSAATLRRIQQEFIPAFRDF